MKTVDTSSVLNQFVAMHARSLPVYLTDAVPYYGQSNESAKTALRAMADDQMLTVDRLAERIQSTGGAVTTGAFPMHFANWHDLSLDFLVRQCAKRQADDIATMESLLPSLEADPKSRSLAEEAIGAAKANLDTLADLASVTS